MSALNNLSQKGKASIKSVKYSGNGRYEFGITTQAFQSLPEECVMALKWVQTSESGLVDVQISVDDGKYVTCLFDGTPFPPIFSTMVFLSTPEEAYKFYDYFDFDVVARCNWLRDFDFISSYSYQDWTDIPGFIWRFVTEPLLQNNGKFCSDVFYISHNGDIFHLKGWEQNKEKYSSTAIDYIIAPVKSVEEGLTIDDAKYRTVDCGPSGKFVVRADSLSSYIKDDILQDMLCNGTYMTCGEVHVGRDEVYGDDYNNIRTTSNEVVVTGNIIVKGECAIRIDRGCDEVRFSGNGNVILMPLEMQPCIGMKTCTGMSYGRWSPNDYNDLKKIIVAEDCRIVCISRTPNFSIGSYNYEEYPEVVLEDRGRLNCPEMLGIRKLVKVAKAPQGSTKISESAEYKILVTGADESTLFSGEQISLIKDIMQYNPAWKDLCKYDTPVKHLEIAKHLLECKPDLDVSLMLKSNSKRRSYILKTMVVLGLPYSYYDGNELLFECRKLEYLANKYGIEFESESCTENVMNCIRKEYSGKELSDWDYEVVYESIPSYFFNFEGSLKENVERFLAG